MQAGDEDVGRFTYGDIHMNYFSPILSYFYCRFFLRGSLVTPVAFVGKSMLCSSGMSKDKTNPQQKETTSKKHVCRKNYNQTSNPGRFFSGKKQQNMGPVAKNTKLNPSKRWPSISSPDWRSTVCQVSKTGEITFRAPLAIAPRFVFLMKNHRVLVGGRLGWFVVGSLQN